MASAEVGVSNFEVGMTIKVKVINPSVDRFGINLCGSDGDILLHLNSRISGQDSKSLVLNHRHCGKWGREERPSGFDFTPGIKATIKFEAKADSFHIYNNGRLLHQFSHRLPLQQVRKIEFVPQKSCAVLKSIKVCYT